MDAKTRRLLKSKQARTVAGSGNIAASEGESGDIQVRMTNHGPRLYAKIGNKWFVAELKEEGSSQDDIRMHAFKGLMAAGSSTEYIPIPSWIEPTSIVGIIFFANHSGNFWHIYNWADLTDDPESGTKVTRHRVLYDRGSHRIQVDRMGNQMDDGKYYRVIVFFK